jgi:small redox-active disulfide protein 2
MVEIQVLGSGCANCHKVEALAKQAVAQMAIDADVKLVTDMETMMRYGIMATPAIVINEKVVSAGRVPALSQIKSLITTALAQAGEREPAS